MGKKSGKNISTRKAYDNDTEVFISMAREHKDEGNKLFQKKDYEGAILKYEKSLNLLPANHITVSYLHSSIAACYMQMGIADFPKAINECNLALEITPKYSKALIKRARCYEALNMPVLAFRDVNLVLEMEPKNLMAIEIFERVKTLMGKNLTEENGGKKEKTRKKEEKVEKKNDGCEEIKTEPENEEKETEDKLVFEEKISVFSNENESKRRIKLVFGDDIRWAKIPFNCDILNLREIIFERFPLSRAVLMKYRDQEGDMVTITTNDELRLAETVSGKNNGSVKLYITEVNPEQDPFFDHVRKKERKQKLSRSSSSVDDWILEFAQLFKNYVGFNSDDCLDLYVVGMKLYNDAMEDTITREESQQLFQKAAEKFQEMAAVALFNCGNVHMTRARKRAYVTEDGSHINDSYEWAKKEYLTAGELYKQSIKLKPDFFEGFIALGHQEFEQAKLYWYYEIGKNTDVEKWDHKEVFELYNKAEDNIEKGMKMSDENTRSLINVLWGTLLYERSSMEYKLGISFWHECLEIAVEKFELAGVSRTDIAVIIKNHCSNDSTPEGLGFDIDEIVQAWHEMYEVKRWQSGVPSFRLEPLLRRRVSKLFYASEYTK